MPPKPSSLWIHLDHFFVKLVTKLDHILPRSRLDRHLFRDGGIGAEFDDDGSAQYPLSEGIAAVLIMVRGRP